MALRSLVVLRGDTVSDLSSAEHQALVFIPDSGNFVIYAWDSGASAWAKAMGTKAVFVTDPAGGLIVDTNARAAVISILAALIAHGVMASS